MARAITVYVASDQSRWDNEADAVKRDKLDASIRAIEATLPKRPSESRQRVAVDPDTFRAAKNAVVSICREQFPDDWVFTHPPMDIHPLSLAGRIISDRGGPIDRVWHWFMCHSDGWLYEQPFYAFNPDKFEGDK